ncbi:hypothetical protein ACTPOK_20095 [Streptomyces inhibens]|uniref:hypothetical protein n=1 Tax=Streptomyces inhibens TaxID=2293571 RepID=UPI00402B035B
MKLAIGDVVRDRSNMELGAVAGLTAAPDGGNLVALQMSGGGIRVAESYDLDLVARRSRPMTTGQNVMASVVFVAALAAAVFGFCSAQELGADWMLTLLASVGSYTAVTSTFHWWMHLTGPRRFRV